MASKIKAAIREVEKISAAVGGRDTTPAKWMGKWEAEKSYGTLQKVEHLGNSYVCIKNCAGVDPEADVALGDGVQGVCWLLIAKKGDDGEGIESIDEVGGGEEIDGNRVVGRWKDYRITYASGKTLDYRVFGGADGKQGPAGAAGQPGPAGPAGKDGVDGKDGLDGTVAFDELTAAQRESLRGEEGPVGPPGESGVYIGSEEPENANVWIDPSGQMDVGGQVYPERWTFDLSDGITVVEKMVVLA
jgi:hypothetical protein